MVVRQERGAEGEMEKEGGGCSIQLIMINLTKVLSRRVVPPRALKRRAVVSVWVEAAACVCCVLGLYRGNCVPWGECLGGGCSLCMSVGGSCVPCGESKCRPLT